MTHSDNKLQHSVLPFPTSVLLPAEDGQGAAANDQNTRDNEAQDHRNIHALTAEERSVADCKPKKVTLVSLIEQFDRQKKVYYFSASAVIIQAQ